MFNDDLEFLVSETLGHVVDKEEKKSLLNFFEDRPLKGEQPSQVSGLFYHLQKKASTFVIRVMESANLADDYPKILENPEDYPSLRLLEDDDGFGNISEKLKFFETDTIEQAKFLKQHLGNKRFPMFEEHIFNVSDPGDSWWIKDDAGRFTVYFKLSRTESIDKLTKIGPLGDSMVAVENFNKMYGYLGMLFPIKDFSSCHGQFSISCDMQHHPIYSDFKKIFSTGDVGFEFWEYMRQLEMTAQGKDSLRSIQMANFYLMQISTTRRFWMEIQEQLGV